MVERKKALPPTYLLVALVVMVALHFVLPVRPVVAWPWRLVGLAPLGLGVWLNLAADGAFRRAETTVKPFEASDTLVTTGVFRISRNPMYLGFVLIVLGVALGLGTATPLVVAPALAAALHLRFIRPEERMLAARFGEAWAEYQSRVRRWI